MGPPVGLPGPGIADRHQVVAFVASVGLTAPAGVVPVTARPTRSVTEAIAPLPACEPCRGSGTSEQVQLGGVGSGGSVYLTKVGTHQGGVVAGRAGDALPCCCWRPDPAPVGSLRCEASLSRRRSPGRWRPARLRRRPQRPGPARKAFGWQSCCPRPPHVGGRIARANASVWVRPSCPSSPLGRCDRRICSPPVSWPRRRRGGQGAPDRRRNRCRGDRLRDQPLGQVLVQVALTVLLLQ